MNKLFWENYDLSICCLSPCNPAIFLLECNQGQFGSNCANTCDCDGDTPCHPVSGRCLCVPGKMGTRCDISKNKELIHSFILALLFFCRHYSSNHLFLCLACALNRYGPECSESCDCGNGAQCNPRNGRCICSNGWIGPSCLEGTFIIFAQSFHFLFTAVTSLFVSCLQAAFLRLLISFKETKRRILHNSAHLYNSCQNVPLPSCPFSLPANQTSALRKLSPERKHFNSIPEETWS